VWNERARLPKCKVPPARSGNQDKHIILLCTCTVLVLVQINTVNFGAPISKHNNTRVASTSTVQVLASYE
jgi:hypothetical protein